MKNESPNILDLYSAQGKISNPYFENAGPPIGSVNGRKLRASARLLRQKADELNRIATFQEVLCQKVPLNKRVDEAIEVAEAEEIYRKVAMVTTRNKFSSLSAR